MSGNEGMENVMNSELESMLHLEGANRVPIYLEAYRKLRSLITGGYFKKGEKLAGEAQLAEMMNIGRTSLRTALVLLYEDGYVVTEHGRGTFVTYEQPEESKEFPGNCMTMRDRLGLTGHKVTIAPAIANAVTGDAFLDEKLSAKGQRITMMSYLYSLDGKPAVLSQMFVISGLADSLEEMESIFGSTVSYVTSSFASTVLSNAPFSVPQFSDAKNVLLVSSTWRDAGRCPVCYTKDYINNDICRYKISQSK